METSFLIILKWLFSFMYDNELLNPDSLLLPMCVWAALTGGS